MEIEELQTALDDILPWRREELTRAKFLANNAIALEDKNYLCRAWIVLMYAHCDKFLKESTELYLQYLQSANDTNYRADLLWLLIKGKTIFQEDKENKKYKSFNDYLTFQDTTIFADIIDYSQSSENFNYFRLRALCDWIMQIKYDHDKYRGFCDKLVKARNKIAHGEKLHSNSLEYCDILHHDTMEFMSSLADKIIESAIMYSRL